MQHKSICDYFCRYFFVSDVTKHMMPTSFMPHLYQDLPPIGKKSNENNTTNSDGLGLNISTTMIPSFGSKLGLLLPDPAPDVAPNPDNILSSATTQLGVAQTSMKNIKHHCLNTSAQIVESFAIKSIFTFLFTDKMADNSLEITNTNEPRKKKYAKEAWPGRKPLLSGL